MTGLIPKTRREKYNRPYGFSTFPTLSSWLDEIINDGFGNEIEANPMVNGKFPAVNIKENNTAIELEMAVPGMKKSDFNIDLDDSVLTISAESTNENEVKEENYTRREFGFTSFNRSFTLPETIDESQIKATYNDGILNILIPKKEEEKKKVKKIELS
ncbi:MAG: Hsp20/alpha crystallin family protein [Flavobacteriaceae bacterium]|nr:Hsp20/alpha crystallin family protein [Bacteroidia bacterium]MBT8287068.1 Hsp20/alpha crystallin family protein [Bacteroidia bacterium]NNF74602.1 Hsp20/alpha crystallin family protein [Flavobacteriaceae bacterium]NNK73523.1 Hsp20/alpha crystallin family protein [Flavobacteriaceae bacterium]